MKLYTKIFVSLVALTTTILIHSPASAQARGFGTSSQVSVNSTVDEVVRNAAFEDALKKVYYENPRIYEAHSEVLKGKWATYKQRGQLFADRTSIRVYRVLPSTSPLISSLKEYAKMDWEDRKIVYDINTRIYMSKNPREVDDVARQIRTQMYDRNAPDYIKDAYNMTRLHEGTNKLPSPVTLDGLRQQYPGIVSDLERKGLTKEQIERYRAGDMGKKEFMTISNIRNEEEYRQYIENNYSIEIDVNTLPTVQTRTPTQKELDFDNHKKKVAAYQAKVYAGTAILSLIDPETAEKITTINNAAVLLYDNIGAMLINGAIDPTGIGNIASGVKMLTGLFGGPSPEQVVMDMLSDVLKNQKEILGKLNEIEIKVDKLQTSVSYLILLSDLNHQEVMGGIHDINKKLDDIIMLDYRGVDNQRLLFQDAISRAYADEKAGLTAPFTNRIGSSEWLELYKGLRKPARMSSFARSHFGEINKLLGKMATFATKEIEDPSSAIFRDLSDISLLSREEIKAKGKTDITQRMGMLPHIGKWLGAHLKMESIYGPYTPVPEEQTLGFDFTRRPPVEYSKTYSGELVNGSGLDIQIGNPAIFSKTLQDYVDLSRYRPIEYYDGRNQIVYDKHINEFCEDLGRTELSIIQMRKHIPLAIAVFNFHCKTLSDLHTKSVLTFATNLKILDKHISENGKKVIFSGLSEKEIYDIVSDLNEETFSKIAYQMGILKTEIVKRDELVVVGTKRVEWTSGGPEKNDRVRIDNVYGTFRTEQVFKELSDEIHRVYGTTARYMASSIKQRIDIPNQKLVIEATSDTTSRKTFASIITKEIVKRQHEIELRWRDFLNKEAHEYVVNIYRSAFVLNTLLQGGYGKHYAYIPELYSFIEVKKSADNVLNFIEDSWEKGKKVLDIYRADENSSVDSYLLTKKTSHKERINSKPFVNSVYQHLEKYAFITISDVEGRVATSWVTSRYNMSSFQNPFIIDIGDLQGARDALKFASQYKDIKPSSDCLKLH